MKTARIKTLSVFFSLVLILSLPFLGACTVEKQSALSMEIVPPSIFTEAEMKSELSAFLGKGGERKDRTAFSDGEKAAARYLKTELDDMGGYETEVREFTYTPYEGTDLKYTSQNVVAVKKSETKNARNVILGTNYDNQYGEFALPAASRYSTPQVILPATKSEGAYKNGTGVAMLLQIARRIASEEGDFGYNLYIVFFGAGELWDLGSDSFVEKYASQIVGSTFLMMNFSRIGGDNIYAYSDEAETPHHDFVTRRAELCGVALSDVPATLPRMPAQYIDGISYAHLGMVGGSAAFANRSIPYVNIFGGTFDTLSYGLDEAAGQSNIVYTENDDLKGLEANLPAYAKAMTGVAEMTYSCLTSPELLTLSVYSRTDYSVFMWEWVPALIAIGVILLFGLSLIPVARHYEKKYPRAKPKPKKLKVAVFGMDYETPEENDIFIDMKDLRSGKDDDDDSPFKGY